MKVNEIIKMHEGMYNYIELYQPMGNATEFHTDKVRSFDPAEGYGDCVCGKENQLNRTAYYNEAISYQLMDCKEYNATILANCSITTEDFGWKENEKILCILISNKINLYNGEYNN